MCRMALKRRKPSRAISAPSTACNSHSIHASFRVHSGNVPSVQKMTLGAIGARTDCRGRGGLGQREMAMTGRPDHDLGLSAREVEVKHTWQLVEQHGLGWAYDGELPPPEAFQTHNRPGHLRILGPYPSRVVAETLLRRIRAALPLR